MMLSIVEVDSVLRRKIDPRGAYCQVSLPVASIISQPRGTAEDQRTRMLAELKHALSSGLTIFYLHECEKHEVYLKILT
jgi:hypothetical protein